MKKVRRMIAFVLSVSLMVGVFAPSALATHSQPDRSDAFVDVLVGKSNDTLIFASVAADEADAYRQRLEQDVDFRNEQIDLATADLSVQTRSLPEGPIAYQAYMYADDIRELVDKRNEKGAFQKFIDAYTKPATNTAVNLFISELLKRCGKSSVPVLAASILVCELSIARQQETDWWEAALIDIVFGDKSYVRYTIVENRKSEYPKAWRVFELI